MKYQEILNKVKEDIKEIEGSLRHVSDEFCKITDNCFKTETRFKEQLYELTLSDAELIKQDIFFSDEHFKLSVQKFFYLLKMYEDVQQLISLK